MRTSPVTINRPELVARRVRPHAPDVVLIGENVITVELASDVLTNLTVNLHVASGASDGLRMIATLRPALVIVDVNATHAAAMELLHNILDVDADVDIILLTATYSTDAAVEAIQKGAYDYLTKPISPARLRQRIEKWIADSNVRKRTAYLERELLSASSFEGILGRSPFMLELFSKMRRIAPHFQTVLITGETGTGKELIARALHKLSPVASGPFVVCNCAALVETLLESELFGHVKGAFTGAFHDKKGLVELADGGTVFLDEIGEMPLVTQAKLLRLIQNREIQRVGSGVAQKVSVRIIAATHRNLKSPANSSFREDLYYRLSVVNLQVPRLIERREDVPILVHHFLRSYGDRYGRPALGMSRKAHVILARHHWPGNVRELENVIAHACMLAEGNTIDVRDLPADLVQRTPVDPHTSEELLPLDVVMRQHAMRVLQAVGNSRVRAAEILGISRATLYRLIASSEPTATNGKAFASGPGHDGAC